MNWNHWTYGLQDRSWACQRTQTLPVSSVHLSVYHPIGSVYQLSITPNSQLHPLYFLCLPTIKLCTWGSSMSLRYVFCIQICTFTHFFYLFIKKSGVVESLVHNCDKSGECNKSSCVWPLSKIHQHSEKNYYFSWMQKIKRFKSPNLDVGFFKEIQIFFTLLWTILHRP